MGAVAPSAEYSLQHLIDPEVCIRCNTCEATCPVDAISHDSRNYVVDFAICNNCNACVPPCPTGAIDHWQQVLKATPYTLDDQFSWDALPAPLELEVATQAEVPNDVRQLTEIATAGQGGPASPPWSAAHPYVNLYSQAKPALAMVAGNYRLTAEDASADIRHVVLDFGTTAFPVLEGQTLGILPPGFDQNGKPHHVRLYSVASPRDGERPRYNNVALTVKRVTADHSGKPVTGSAPMRAMTERRRRRRALKEGGEMLLFFGARLADELPYFGPLLKLPKDFIDINFAFSRVPDQPKTYVQDRIRERAEKVVHMLQDDNCYIYLCGLKDMETGVIEAFRDVCSANGLDWDALKPQLLAKSRLHIETY